MTSIRKPTGARQTLSEHEWQFDDLPNDELEACYLYEYARELFKGSKHLKNFQKEWRNPANKRTGRHLTAMSKAWDLLGTHCKNFPCVDFDYFPQTAWQNLPSAWPKGAPNNVQRDLRRSFASEVNDWSKRFQKSRFDRLNIATLRELEPPNVHSLEAFKFLHECSPRRKLEQPEYGYFAIDWSYSDPEIKRAFGEWLIDQRQERRKLGLSASTPVSFRGGFRDRLRWLGALRVKNHYRHRDLVDHADTNIKVTAPYSHYPDLREAAQKAKQEIDKLFAKEWSEADYWRRRKQEHKNLMEAVRSPAHPLYVKELAAKVKSSLS